MTKWNVLNAGDEKAFQLLFREYYPQLYLYGFKIIQQKELLEDIIQELFIDFWRRGNLAEIKSLKAYLIKSLRYKIFKKLQNQKLLAFADNDAHEISFVIARETLIIQNEEDRQKELRVEKMLGLLSNRQREIIYLRFYRDLSYEEISEVMNINYQASRNLLSQAIKVLRQLEMPIMLLVTLMLKK